MPRASACDGEPEVQPAGTAVATNLAGRVRNEGRAPGEVEVKQAARNIEVIDVFARALRDLDREVSDERMRREILERRLREYEARLEDLARVVAALARQGWVN